MSSWITSAPEPIPKGGCSFWGDMQSSSWNPCPRIVASAEDGVIRRWRAEESDEHLVPTTAGVYRCRTIRRLLRSDRELLLGLKGVPWDVTAGALPRAKPEKITMRLAVPAPEVIRKGDGLETPGEALDNAPTTPENQEAQEEVTEPPQRPGEGHGGSSQPALTAPASPARRPVVRGSEGPDSPTKSVMQPIIWIETVDRMKSWVNWSIWICAFGHRRSAS